MGTLDYITKVEMKALFLLFSFSCGASSVIIMECLRQVHDFVLNSDGNSDCSFKISLAAF